MKSLLNLLPLILTTLTAAIVLCATHTFASVTYQSLYTNQNLSGFDVNPECNPDGNTPCFDNCTDKDIRISDNGTDKDIRISDNGTFGTVSANTNNELIWVNAIGGKQFVDTFPEDTPVSLGTYKYTCQVRLPIMPDKAQPDGIIPEGIHLVMFLWDGDEVLFESNRETLEAGLFWNINPWHEGQESYGRVKVYTSFDPIVPIETQTRLDPDTEWHTFELVADFEQQKYVSLTVDGVTEDLSSVDVARVDRSDWGRDLAFIVTTESLPMWPTADCVGAYTWTTHFRNLEIHRAVEAAESTTSSQPTTTSTTGAADTTTSSTAEHSTTSTTESAATTSSAVETTTSATQSNSTTTTSADGAETTTAVTDSQTTSTTAAENPCPVAAIYGEQAPQTQLLRRFRDRVLRKTPQGRLMVARYYHCATLLTEMAGRNEPLKKIVRSLIDGTLPLVEVLLQYH